MLLLVGPEGIHFGAPFGEGELGEIGAILLQHVDDAGVALGDVHFALSFLRLALALSARRAVAMPAAAALPSAGR